MRLPHRSTRGDESRFHSLLSLKEAIDAGQTGGFHIPRAPGRTFTASAAGALAAGDAPSLFFGNAVTLPDHRAIRFAYSSILSGFFAGVKTEVLGQNLNGG